MEENADKSYEFRIMSYECGVKKGITIMCMGGGARSQVDATKEKLLFTYF